MDCVRAVPWGVNHENLTASAGSCANKRENENNKPVKRNIFLMLKRFTIKEIKLYYTKKSGNPLSWYRNIIKKVKAGE